MSTRATYRFFDDRQSFTIYKHFDGYPEGGLRWIEKAKEKAWPLDRFEASDFGAAFVAANKDGAGNVYLTEGHDSHGDTQYTYDVTCCNGELVVSINGAKAEKLDDLLKQHCGKGEVA